LFVAVAVVALSTAADASAQRRIGIPTISAADSLLNHGIAEFKEGRYDAAGGFFARVYSDFEPNASSSTARLMAAKAAYRTGAFARTRSILAGFASDFPTSSYLNAAKNLDDSALRSQSLSSDEALNLGVMLSLTEEDRVSSQALFNGIRMAVDEHNSRSDGRKVRMIYRDVGEGTAAASRAVGELANEDVELIIGTLYSEEAVAAANRAERERVVFMAPLATDSEVSDGRQYSFQANASMKSRGEAMARFAVNGLRLKRLGVISSTDDRMVGERLSDGFIQVASALGAEINFIDILPDDSYWFQVPDLMPADTLDLIDALYVPMATRTPAALAGAILSSFDRMGRTPRLLGNAAWHDLPQKAHASEFTTTYTNDYYVDEASGAYLQFRNAYEELSGEPVNRLAVTGYDVTSFALRALSRNDTRQLYDVVRAMPEFEGLGLRIHFDGGNVNKYFFYHRYRDNSLALIR